MSATLIFDDGSRISMLARAPYLADGQVIHVHNTLPRDHYGISVNMAFVLLIGNFGSVFMCHHADLFNAIRIVKTIGLSQDNIDAQLLQYTASRNWLRALGNEYLHLLYTECESAVDFKRYFREHKAPFEMLASAIALPYYQTRVDELLAMLSFYAEYDFTTCFEGNDGKMLMRINKLKKAKASAWKSFLVNIHEPQFANYLRYTPDHITNVWDCKNISVAQPLEVDQPVIADLDTCIERFHEFTCGIFRNGGFPADNVEFAGGSINKIIDARYDKKHARQSDLDVFIYANTFEERSNILSRVAGWFDSFNTTLGQANVYYAVIGSVMTVYIKNTARKFQIISGDCCDPYEVISRFDMSHLQVCLLNGKFYATSHAVMALRSHITCIHNDARLKTNRMIKALHCGYSIKQDQRVIEKLVDITQLISDPNSPQLRKIIRDLHGWYYPTNMADMDPEEESQHILCQIEKDANATVVTTDLQYALYNITIGGNFDDGYMSTPYSTFNPAIIVNNVGARRLGTIHVSGVGGPIRLTSCMCDISHITVSDQGILIEVIPQEDSFKQFCNTIEGPVFRMYRAGTPSNHLMNGNKIVLNINRLRVENQVRFGKSLLYSQRGESLNIEEDLAIDDCIQFKFTIDIVAEVNATNIVINPVRISKFQKYDLAAAEQSRNEINEIAEFTAQEADEAPEIEYGE